jgi:hypothetical protein
MVIRKSILECPAGCPVKKVDKESHLETVGDQATEEQFARLNVSEEAECPAGHTRTKTDVENRKETGRDQTIEGQSASKCPVAHDKKQEAEAGTVAAKCPLGYDSVSFKIGPLSCVICRALLFQSSRCVPCQHIFCRLVLCPRNSYVCRFAVLK